MVIKLKEVMMKKGVNQTELAKRLNINRVHLNKVINGKVRPSTALLERIAKELNCSIRDFF